MKIEILNRQRIKRINLKRIKSYLKKIFTRLNISSKKISIVFCDNSFIKSLNKKFFKKSNATDVISFSLDDELDPDYMGEVVVSVEEATRIADKRKYNWEVELTLYLIHGILHLLGYKDARAADKKRMQRKEAQIIGDIFGRSKDQIRIYD